MMTARHRHPPVVAILFAAAIVAARIWLDSQSPQRRDNALDGASTSVAHLEHDPWRVIPESALWPSHYIVLWMLGIAVCVGVLEMLRGSWVVLAVGVTGHVVGTLVSELVIGVRVAVGNLPDSARHLRDIGPSYVLVSCGFALIASATTHPRWRIAAVIALLPLGVETFVGVADGRVDAIGHLVAAAVGTVAARWIGRPASEMTPHPATA